MTWPSFFAASIRAGVTGSGGGAAARTRVENAAPASKTPEPLSTVRRDILGCFIGSFYRYVARDSVHPKLSFIPAAHIESFVDTLLPLPLDLAAKLGQQQVQYRTRPEF